MERPPAGGILVQLGFPNLMLARAAMAGKRRVRLTEGAKREAFRRNRFAILDDLPPYDDLSEPVKATVEKAVPALMVSSLSLCSHTRNSPAYGLRLFDFALRAVLRSMGTPGAALIPSLNEGCPYRKPNPA